MDGRNYNVNGVGVSITAAATLDNKNAVAAQFKIGDKDVRYVLQAKNPKAPMLRDGKKIPNSVDREAVILKMETHEQLSQGEMRMAVEMIVSDVINRQASFDRYTDVDLRDVAEDNVQSNADKNLLREKRVLAKVAKKIDEMDAEKREHQAEIKARPFREVSNRHVPFPDPNRDA
jgi:predicted AAA+ superfamily ATPase